MKVEQYSLEATPEVAEELRTLGIQFIPDGDYTLFRANPGFISDLWTVNNLHHPKLNDTNIEGYFTNRT